MSISTLSRRERFLLATRCEEVDYAPTWVMRQAGRYMPEYMELRRRYTFKDFCLNPEVAAAATLLPLRLLDIDIMIIFNDILIPLEEMGMPVTFPEGGPVMDSPIRSLADVERLKRPVFDNPAVARSISLVKHQAGPDVPILGFCGAPFTLACYAVEGKMSKDQHHVKGFLYENPAAMHLLLEKLSDVVVDYLIAQVEQGGADGVQMFESWGGILPMPHDYEEFGARYQQRVIQRFKAACPDTPIILYVRGGAGKLAMMEATGATVLGIDQSTSLADARRQTRLCVQGNLDPMVVAHPDAVDREVEKMVRNFDMRHGWIANLGHGITPQGSVEAVKNFVKAVRRVSSAQ